MALAKVFWGARCSGKTTALLTWAWQKKAIWLMPNQTKLRWFVEHYPQMRNQLTLDVDALRGCTYAVVDDAELYKYMDLRLLEGSLLHLAVAFTPPPPPESIVTYKYLMLKDWAKHQNAEHLPPMITEADLVKLKETLKPAMYKTQWLGEFADDV